MPFLRSVLAPIVINLVAAILDDLTVPASGVEGVGSAADLGSDRLRFVTGRSKLEAACLCLSIGGQLVPPVLELDRTEGLDGDTARPLDSLDLALQVFGTREQEQSQNGNNA